MKAPHIVHLSTYPADDIRVFQKACKSEVAEGYRVTEIVCGVGDETVDGVEIRSIAPAKGRLARMTGLCWRMYREARPQNADLYQFHHPDLIPAGLLLKLSGRKVIYEPREFFPDKILSMRWIPAKLRPAISAAFALYERTTSAMWDHVIVADRYSAKAFYDRPVSVVPNYPLLVSVELPMKQNNKRKLIYVGGLSEDRGLLVMVKIAELLRDHNVELELMGKFAFPRLMFDISGTKACGRCTSVSLKRTSAYYFFSQCLRTHTQAKTPSSYSSICGVGFRWSLPIFRI